MKIVAHNTHIIRISGKPSATAGQNGTWPIWPETLTKLSKQLRTQQKTVKLPSGESKLHDDNGAITLSQVSGDTIHQLTLTVADIEALQYCMPK